MKFKLALFLIVFVISLFVYFNEQTQDFVVKREQVFDFQKTDQAMADEEFWALIESSRLSDDFLFGLKIQLNDLSAQQIIHFEVTMMKLIMQSRRGDLWCACYLINGGCSDDGFEYFRYWLISQGKRVFLSSTNNPDNLAQIVSSGLVNSYELEPLMYLAGDLFHAKTNLRIHEYIDYNKIFLELGEGSKIELKWSESDPESMRQICPLLYEKFN